MAMGVVMGMATGGSWVGEAGDGRGEACGSACGDGDVRRKVLYVLCDEWMDGRLKQEVRT